MDKSFDVVGWDDLGREFSPEKINALVQAQQTRNAAAQEKINAATHGSVSLHDLDSKARKDLPICTGVLDYFPNALAAVAMLSKAGNDKHNPGQPLHWSRDKSTDHADCLVRHQATRFQRDEWGLLHATAVAWRALAQLEIALETMPMVSR